MSRRYCLCMDYPLASYPVSYTVIAPLCPDSVACLWTVHLQESLDYPLAIYPISYAVIFAPMPRLYCLSMD